MTKIHRGSIKKNKRSNSRKNNALKNRVRNLRVRLNSSIECAKESFYRKIVNKLNDTQKNAKAHWSSIKCS